MSLFSLKTCTPLKATPWSTPWELNPFFSELRSSGPVKKCKYVWGDSRESLERYENKCFFCESIHTSWFARFVPIRIANRPIRVANRRAISKGSIRGSDVAKRRVHLSSNLKTCRHCGWATKSRELLRLRLQFVPLGGPPSKCTSSLRSESASERRFSLRFYRGKMTPTVEIPCGTSSAVKNR